MTKAKIKTEHKEYCRKYSPKRLANLTYTVHSPGKVNLHRVKNVDSDRLEQKKPLVNKRCELFCSCEDPVLRFILDPLNQDRRLYKFVVEDSCISFFP